MIVHHLVYMAGENRRTFEEDDIQINRLKSFSEVLVSLNVHGWKLSIMSPFGYNLFLLKLKTL